MISCCSFLSSTHVFLLGKSHITAYVYKFIMLQHSVPHSRLLNSHCKLIASYSATSPPCRLFGGRQGLALPQHALVPAVPPAVAHQQQLQQQRSKHVARITPFDQAWGTQIDGQSLASQLFAMSLFPYLAFLFYLTRSGKAPRLMLAGFYFLLVFVGATIPAGIYAKTHYGTSLANVDWLHGTAESLLTVTNLLIVLGLRQGIRQAEAERKAAEAAAAAATAPNSAVENAGGSSNGAPLQSTTAVGANKSVERFDASKS